GEGGNDEVYSNKFILCSLNKTDQPKRNLVFDYIEKEFKANSDIDPIINLNKPMTGFLFPAFTDNAGDVNHILYIAGNVNLLDYSLFEEVLHCEEIYTADDDKDGLEFIVSKVSGGKVYSTVIFNCYEEIDNIVQENEENEDEADSPTLDYRDVETVLRTSGIENVDESKVKDAFNSVIENEKHECKASSLLPKTENINTETMKIIL